MKQIIQGLIENVLTALYQPFGCALVLAILIMFLQMFAEEKGWKQAVHCWLINFKTKKPFRCMFILMFYMSMILLRTLLNRYIWANPVANVIGVWGLYNANGDFTTEVIENLVLFIPFTILLFWTFREKIFKEGVRFNAVLGKSVGIVFLFSLTIEFLQLFLRLGTFQLSYLFYNTLGGLIGGLLYWIGYKVRFRKK